MGTPDTMGQAFLTLPAANRVPPGGLPASGRPALTVLLKRLLQLRLAQRLHVNPDDNLVADNNATVFQLPVPTDLKVMAVNVCLAHKADPRHGPGVAGIGPIGRSPLTQVMHVQDNRAADAADGQRTG